MRLKSLDSLRGVAALVVVLHHCALTFPQGGEDRGTLLAQGWAAPNAWLYLTPARLLVAGPAAVLIFFVLSGLVLATSFVGRDHLQYGPFAIKRVTRIWPAFAVAVLGAALLAATVPLAPVPGASGWFHDIWSEPVTTGLVANHLLMTGRSGSLDNPIWSLIHEVRISLVFPLLVRLTTADWKATFAAALVTTVATAKLAATLHPTGMAMSLMTTATYLFLFVAGIVIALHLEPLQRRLAGQGKPVHLALWMVALGGIAVAPERTDQILGFRNAALLLSSGAAAILIVLLCTIEGRVLRALLGPVPAYFGRISYSLYLVHVPIVAAVVHLTAGSLPLPLAVAIAAVLSIGVADASQRWIEVPTTAWGRLLAERWPRRTPALQRRPHV